MSVAYIGLGANLATHLGEPHSTLTLALDDLAALPGTRITARSAFFQTTPVDADGPDFINAAVALDTSLDAPALLAALLLIEQGHGRTRPHPAAGRRGDQHAARTLDLDLLMHGDTMVNTPFLTLPHPRMHLRAFVLTPLFEIAPQLVIPAQGSVRDCLETLGRQGVSRLSPMRQAGRI